MAKISQSTIETGKKAVEKTLEKIGNMEVKPTEDNIAKDRHYNKFRLFANIKYLLAGSDLKIGEIEKAAKAKAGYMSRINKGDSSSEPTLEFVVTSAQMLGVTVDTLLNAKLSELTGTEKYMASFIEKLISDTNKGKLIWKKETEKELNMISNTFTYVSTHPLFETELFDVIDKESGVIRSIEDFTFKSDSYGVQTVIIDNCYNLRMKNGNTLYVMCVGNADPHNKELNSPTIMELWMCSQQKEKTFLASSKNSALGELINALYNALEEYSNHPMIDEEARNVIDAFMKDDLSDDPIEEMPFR